MYRNLYLPQNAIRQSNEFIDLGKRESALEILFEAIRARRGKSWSPPIEEAMNNFLQLCLVLRSSQEFKDGANQYKIVCQTTNVSSFDNVMNKFFTACMEATEKAKSSSREKVLAEDLDELESPETILLKSISETTQQDRTDRLLLSPSLKFTWESFRNILEICKNNKNLEKVYSEIAKKAFKFLLSFERKTEFRKLCDVTRMHLQQVLRYTQNTLSINLGEPSSIEIQLEIRLGQLDAAISMELWNEAFKTMEDIHLLLRLSKKTPHPKILAIFYQKISLVFAKANAPIFHAIALHKLFILIKEHKKGFKPQELTKISSRVLAATISVPISQDQTEIDSLLFRFSDQMANILQLSSILGLSVIPNRNSLIEDIFKISILQYADPSIINIFNALRGVINVSNICEYISNQLNSLPEYLVDDLSSYYEPIRKLSFCALFSKLSKFYQCLSLPRLVTFSSYYTQETVLAIILECSRSGFVKFTYDGEADIIDFSLNSSENPTTHFLVIPDIISFWAKQVSYPIAESVKADQNESSELDLDSLGKHILSEYNRYRKIHEDTIKYQEQISKANDEVDKQMLAKMEEERSRMEIIEVQRMEEERKKRDEERQIRDDREKKMIATREQVNELVNCDIAKKILKDITIEQLEKNPTKYLNVHNELRDKEISLHVKRMKRIEKTADVFIHVIRSKEKYLIDEYLLSSFQKRKEYWQKRDKERLLAIERNNKIFIDVKNRLISAHDDIELYLVSSKEKAIKSHQQLLKEYNDMLQKERETVRTKLIAERKKKEEEKLKERAMKDYGLNSSVIKPQAKTVQNFPKTTLNTLSQAPKQALSKGRDHGF